MSRILVLIDWYLPGYKAGGPIVSVSNLIKALKLKFDFSIITRNTDYCDSIPYENIESDTWIVGNDELRSYYFSTSKLNIISLIKVLKNEKFDYLYINSLYSKYFTIVPLLFLKRSNYKIILAPRGMLSEGAKNIKSFKKLIYFKIAKLICLFNGVIFQASNEEEKNQIQMVFGNKVKIKIAPNIPKQIEYLNKENGQKVKGKVNFSTVARISPEKNIFYALQLLDGLSGDITFNIYGTVYDDSYWNDCMVLIEKLPDNVKVIYHNSIRPELLGEALAQSDFLLFPTTGENFGHVILESLSVGTPVIISDKTPWRQLEKSSVGWDVSLSDKSIFKDVINNCINMESNEYGEISNSALNYALNYIANSDNLQKNIELFSVS